MSARGCGDGRGSGSGDPIIAEVMFKKKIYPQNIPRVGARKCGYFDPGNLDSIRGSERYFLVRGFAWYRQHAGCTRKWASAHSWCVIDLKQQKIIHKYGQDCKTCGGKSTPSFDEEARRRMAEYVCKKYLYRTGRLQQPQSSQPDMKDLSGQREGPHDQSRCDMCKMLGHSCHSSTATVSGRGCTKKRRPLPPSQSVISRCTICGSTNHSGWSCTSRRYRREAANGRSHVRPSRPVPPPPVVHCTICGSTDHSYQTCTSRQYEQERVSSSSQVQAAISRSRARPTGLARVRAAFTRLGALLFGRRQ